MDGFSLSLIRPGLFGVRTVCIAPLAYGSSIKPSLSPAVNSSDLSGRPGKKEVADYFNVFSVSSTNVVQTWDSFEKNVLLGNTPSVQ